MATSQEVAEALGASLVRNRIVVESARTGIRLSLIYHEADCTLKMLIDALPAKRGFVASIALDGIESVQLGKKRVRFHTDRQSTLTITSDAKVLIVQN